MTGYIVCKQPWHSADIRVDYAVDVKQAIRCNAYRLMSYRLLAHPCSSNGPLNVALLTWQTSAIERNNNSYTEDGRGRREGESTSEPKSQCQPPLPDAKQQYTQQTNQNKYRYQFGNIVLKLRLVLYLRRHCVRSTHVRAINTVRYWISTPTIIFVSGVV